MTADHLRGEPAPRRVAVVGAGISGLAAAHAVRRAAPGVEVVVLEASPSVGGKLSRAEVGGVGVDTGAESMLNRRPEAVALAREVGLGDLLVHPVTITANLWSRGRMRPMPRTVMGVPTDVAQLAASGLLTEDGLARAAAEPEQPATRLDGDVSIGALVEERFGPEVVDRLVEPLLGGVYAGHARRLSARATVPQVVALLDRDSSLTRAAAAATAQTSDAPVFAGLVGGLTRLPEALAARLDVRTGSTVRELARSGRGGWDLVVGPTRDARALHADAVVLATPAAPTARLLAGVAPEASRELAAVEYASMAIVTLAFRTRDVPVTEGSGFLVPPVDGRTVKASTYSFAKWAWVRTAGAGLAGGDDVLVLRCSVGRHREEATLQRSDHELARVALADLADAVGLAAAPLDWHVQRWGGALPQYAVGHVDRVRRIRDAVASQAGLAVCGAAYDGLGLPACIASAELAATSVLGALAGRGTMTP